MGTIRICFVPIEQSEQVLFWNHFLQVEQIE